MGAAKGYKFLSNLMIFQTSIFGFRVQGLGVYSRMLRTQKRKEFQAWGKECRIQG